MQVMQANRDVAAFTLGFHAADYRHIGTGAADAFEMHVPSASEFHQGSASLHNGNIRHAVYAIARLHEVSGNAVPEGYNYRYDQLNRLTTQRSRADYTLSSTFAWNTASVGERPHFQEDATYDPNGNILTYRRLGAKSADYLMDSLEYHYGSEDNRLLYITDRQTNYAAYEDDLEDQSSGNYTYDETGNLFEDGYHYHEWTNAQKLAYVSVESDYSLTFRYDATQQNRVAKYETGQGWQRRHYYVRDAQGNVMSTYKLWKHTAMGVTYLDSFKLMEQHIYGSARVGYVQPEQMLYPSVPQNPHALDSCRYTIFEGWKRYEIANHLGNVLAVITDRKRGKGSYDDIEWFAADVLATQQYYPFGMLMPGDTSANVRRQYSLNDYDHRYGFNGKEGDDEVKGDDNQQDYGMRIYDPRAGRFLSVDPIAREYPMLTPYQFASNSPISGIDLDGLEHYFAMDGSYIGLKKGDPTVRVIKTEDVKNQSVEQIHFSVSKGIIKYDNLAVMRNDPYSVKAMTGQELLDQAHVIYGEEKGGRSDMYAHLIQNREFEIAHQFVWIPTQIDPEKIRSRPYNLTDKYGIYNYTIFGVHMPNNETAVEAYRKTIQEGAPQIDGGIRNWGYEYFFSQKDVNDVGKLYRATSFSDENLQRKVGVPTGKVIQSIIKSIIDARRDPYKDDKWRGFEGWRSDGPRNEMPRDSENRPKKN